MSRQGCDGRLRPWRQSRRDVAGQGVTRCPHCGDDNPAGSNRCHNCGQRLPLAPPPPKTPPTAQDLEKRHLYRVGLALGIIPVIVFWIAIGIGTRTTGNSTVASDVAVVGGILYGAEIVAAVILLFIQRYRSIGTGLLTMVFVGPVIWSVGCAVIFSLPH